MHADAFVEACRRACCCMPTRLLLHADAHAVVCRRARCCMLTRFLLCAFLVSTYLVGADSGSCLHTCMGLLSQLRLCILISMPEAALRSLRDYFAWWWIWGKKKAVVVVVEV